MRIHIGAALLLLLALGVKVWIKVVTTDVGYELADQRRRAIELDMEKRDLTLQKSILLRPDHLARMAEQRLEMRPLDPRQARRVITAQTDLSGE